MRTSLGDQTEAHPGLSRNIRSHCTNSLTRMSSGSQRRGPFPFLRATSKSLEKLTKRASAPGGGAGLLAGFPGQTGTRAQKRECTRSGEGLPDNPSRVCKCLLASREFGDLAGLRLDHRRKGAVPAKKLQPIVTHPAPLLAPMIGITNRDFAFVR
jgi:hypothetical protein